MSNTPSLGQSMFPNQANSVQQSSGAAQAGQGAGPTGIGGAIQGAFGSGQTITGPNANAYNQQLAQAQSQSQGFLAGAQGPNAYQQSAPTISNPYAAQSQAGLASTMGQMGQVAGFDQNLMTNGSQVAQNQYQQSLAQSVNSNMAMANSARGGPAAMAAAQRGAQQQNAQTMAGASSQAAIMQAQQQQAGAQGLSQVTGQMGQQQLGQYGLEQQNAQQQAQLASTNQAQQNQMQLGLGALGTQEQGLAGSTLGGYGQQSTAQQALQLQSNQQNSLLGSLGFGGASGALSGLISSDRRVKADVREEGGAGSLVDDFLRKMDPKSYRYRSGLDPSAPGAGERRLGVMAQDLERSDMGRQMVRETPNGKAIDMRDAQSATLASLAQLDARMRELEERGAKR